MTSRSNVRCTLVQKRTSEVMYNGDKRMGIAFASQYIFVLWLFQKHEEVLVIFHRFCICCVLTALPVKKLLIMQAFLKQLTKSKLVSLSIF